uniref:HAT C-terminal dimerisation domain-containing protein n=1 Tax=Mola mola TaxID=94237 RepID=A0A3Q3W4M7_MOLML
MQADTQVKWFVFEFNASKGSTSNMRRHLKGKHPTVLLPGRQEAAAAAGTIPETAKILASANTDPGVSTNTTTSSVQIFVMSPIQPLELSKANEALVKMIAMDYQPFSIVEDRGFRTYTQALDPTYVLPSRATVSKRMLPNLYEKVRTELRERILTVPAVCLTIDRWTSNTTTSYVSVTCHYIQECKLHSKLLDCFVVTKQDTAGNLAQGLSSVAHERGIEGKIVACVTDNTSNRVTAVNEVLRWNHIRCFAHLLNLTVRNAIQLPAMQNIIQKVKNITAYVRRSTVASAKQQTSQALLQPKQDVFTRWNSTFYMLERFLQIKEPLVSTLAVVDPQLPASTLLEWEILRELLKKAAIEFQKQSTQFDSYYNLFSHTYVKCSKAILMARGLQRMVADRQRTPGNDETISELVNCLAAELEKHFGQIERVHVLAEATLLDPRFKKPAFVNERYAEEAVSRVVLAMTRAATPALATEEHRAARSQSEPIPQVWADFEERVASLQPGIQNPHTEALLEMNGFLAEQLVPRTADPLEWWRVRAPVYKNLSTVMKSRLCIVANSVPSERIFSKTGQIITNRRSSLSTSKVRELVFLNANI